MSAFDFRGFLDDLDSKGELFKVPVEVDTLDEMGAFITRADYNEVHSPILTVLLRVPLHCVASPSSSTGPPRLRETRATLPID